MGLTSQCLILATILLFSVSCHILEASATAPEFDPINKNLSFDPNDLARFAIRQYNHQQRKRLQFQSVEYVLFQKVRGNRLRWNVYLTIKAKDGGAVHSYKAVVYQEPRLKSLLAFGTV